MPQASDELRAEFGIDDRPVIRLLEAAGYTRTGDWEWELPPGQDKPTEKEWRAIVFLVDEWDWGGLTTASLDRVRAARDAAQKETGRSPTPDPPPDQGV